MPIVLADRHFAFLGARINERGSLVFATRLSGEVIESSAESEACTDVESAVAALARQITAMHARLLAQGFTVLGVGVGAPGPVRAESGVLRYSERSGWQDAPIRALLEAQLAALRPALVVVVERGVGCIALHQFDLQRTQDDEPLLYLQIGHSVAAAVAGRAGLSHGAHGLLGAISHMQVLPAGPLCHCGRTGCANATVTLRAVERSLGIEISKPGDLDMTQANVRATIDRTGELLGSVIRNLCLAHDPARVFIGGPVIDICPGLIIAAQRSLESLCDPVTMPAPQLETVGATQEAVARGAAVALIDTVVGGRG